MTKGFGSRHLHIPSSLSLQRTFRLQEKPQDQRRTLQNVISSFFPFLGNSFALPRSGAEFPIRIRIRWPNWFRIQSVSGSRRSLHPNGKLLHFSFLRGNILPCLEPEPNSQYGVRIRWPTWFRIQSASGYGLEQWCRYSCIVWYLAIMHHLTPQPWAAMHKLFAHVFYLPLPVFCLCPPSPALGFFLCGGWWGGGGEYFLHVWTKPPATQYSAHRAHRTPKSPAIKLQHNYKWPKERECIYTVL